VSAEIYRELARLLEQGERVATATVVATRGAVPREVGAKMIVHAEGRHIGTVGGGCGEADVIRSALQAIEAGAPRLVEVDLTEEVSMESQGVCGGVMEVWVEPWSDASLPGALDPPLALLTVVEGGSGRALLRAAGPPSVDLGLSAEALDQARAALRAGRSRTIESPGIRVFVEVLDRPPTLLIAGAGHIALPLCRIGKLLAFRVVVLDDRAGFANRRRFPEADEVLAEPFVQALRRLPIDASTHIVLVTRGHQHDVDCLLSVLDSPAAYLGMIGSRRRVTGVFSMLAGQGIPEEKLRRVHSPIGLDIGAETPEEIALAIAAEIVKVRRGGGGGSLSRGHASAVAPGTA
jgi:xanthine dehydrogenase accessory factor